MSNEILLPDIRAKQVGKTGRRHILGLTRINDEGRPEVFLTCPHPRCGCSGWYDLGSLLEDYKRILEDERKERAA